MTKRNTQQQQGFKINLSTTIKFKEITQFIPKQKLGSKFRSENWWRTVWHTIVAGVWAWESGLNYPNTPAHNYESEPSYTWKDHAAIVIWWMWMLFPDNFCSKWYPVEPSQSAHLWSGVVYKEPVLQCGGHSLGWMEY